MELKLAGGISETRSSDSVSPDVDIDSDDLVTEFERN